MHHVIIAAHDGRQLQQLLDYVRSMGVTRVAFPAREYRSERAAGARHNVRSLPAGERTVRNIRRMDDSERDTMRLPDRDYVREVLCSDGPPPAGLDPEMISAARRIARRLGLA